MSKEQKIIEYLETNGPSLSYVISKNTGLSTSSIFHAAEHSGEIVYEMSFRPGTQRKAILYSLQVGDAPMFCRHTVKAVYGMAPMVPAELKHFVNPFQL